MPRQPRLEAPGLLYHVIARGVERKEIFRNHDDYRAFQKRLGDVLNATKVECLAFSLMPNHFHLLLKQGDIPLSTAMRRLLTGYAVYFNRKYKRALISYLAVSQIGLSFAQTAGLLNIHRSTVRDYSFGDVI